MDVEKLIRCVRAHVCLYDLGQKQYKNTALKNAIWESIGREMNQSGEAVKQKWKTIRDGYTKYKKQLKVTSGSYRRNIGYTWASQLAFLDLFNVPRESYSHVSPEVIQSTPSSPQTYYSDYIPQSPVPSPSTQMPSPSHISSPPPQAAPSSRTPQSSSQSATSSSVSARKSNRHSESDDDVGRALQFINNKKRRELDVTDNLFLSYADTFKKFPPREQAIVKLELAKLFSNIELSLLDSNSYINLQQPSMSMSSPAYSTTSSVVMSNQDIESPISQPINQFANDNYDTIKIEHLNSKMLHKSPRRGTE